MQILFCFVFKLESDLLPSHFKGIRVRGKGRLVRATGIDVGEKSARSWHSEHSGAAICQLWKDGSFSESALGRTRHGVILATARRLLLPHSCPSSCSASCSSWTCLCST